MTKCTTKTINFSPYKSKKITANFTGGDITSDGGLLLLRETDKKLCLTKQLSKLIPDVRNQSYCDHSILQMLRQRIYGLALGYEDINDHDNLRSDIAMQTAVGSDKELASKSTLSRFENSIDRKSIIAMNKLLVETFINSFTNPPKELILDFDATDDKIHGHQEFRHYHGYYREYCYLPLYVFCGDKLLTSFLRPSNIDAAKYSWAILSLLVKRFREQWPNVKIIFRGDCGFCRHKMFDWCDKNNVDYIVGLPGNKRLQELAKEIKEKVIGDYDKDEIKQRQFDQFYYAAKSWSKKRRAIVKAEHTLLGENTRFIVTNLEGAPQQLYDELYCARGNMENYIKQQQLELFADRTSCHKWWANQFRVMLSSCAYVLFTTMKELLLQGTELAKAQCHTIRIKLLKIGSIVIRNTRRVKFLLSSSYPYQNLFYQIAHKLYPN